MPYQPDPKNHPKKSKLFQVPQLQFFQKVTPMVVPEQFRKGLPAILHPDLVCALYDDLYSLFYSKSFEAIVSLSMPFTAEYESVKSTLFSSFYPQFCPPMTKRFGFIIDVMFSNYLNEVIILQCSQLPLEHPIFQKEARIRRVV